MQSPNSIPTIPRRPIKSSQISSDHDNYDNGSHNSVSGSGSDLNKDYKKNEEDLKSNENLLKEQTIDKRPTETANSMEQVSIPIIPKRPIKKNNGQNDNVSANDQTSLAHKLDDLIKEGSSLVNEVGSDPNVTEVLSNEQESILNSELNDDSSDNGNADGDKTPSNSKTKISFKDDLRSEADSGADSDSSSFNDDLETVLQEKDDEQSRRNELDEVREDFENDTCLPLESKCDKQIDASFVKDNKEHELKDNSIKEENIEEDTGEELQSRPFSYENSQKDLRESYINNDERVSDVGTIIPNSEMKKYEEVRSDNQSPVFPVIPKRPVKHRKQSTEEEADIKSSSCTSETEFIPTNGSESESIDTAPRSSIIQKPDIEKSNQRQPIVPERPNKAKLSEVQNEVGSLSKVPPPKPKKLSSKIAAFQQLFSQEQKSPIKQTKDDSTPDLATTSTTKPFIKKGASKLSSDKIKFAESLNGMMGVGVALPGMSNPSLLKKTAGENSEEDSEDIKQESPITSTSASRGIRAKGPKGKRLPKSLKDPVNIKSEPRFKLTVSDLWEINFESRKNEIATSESEETVNEARKMERISSDLNSSVNVSMPFESEKEQELPVSDTLSQEYEISEQSSATEVKSLQENDTVSNVASEQEAVADSNNDIKRISTQVSNTDEDYALDSLDTTV